MLDLIHEKIKDILINAEGFVKNPTWLSFEIVVFVYEVMLIVFLMKVVK